MAEPKVKPATKKVTSAKTSSAVASKSKTTKATVVTKAKNVAAKKTAVLVAKPKNTKAPAARKSPVPAAEKKVAVNKTATTKKNPVKKTVAKLTPEGRYRMIETAAYFIAERNGFGGCSTEHWATAEIEIGRKLGQ